MKFKILLLIRKFVIFIFGINKEFYFSLRRKVLANTNKTNKIILVKRNGQRIYNPKIKNLQIEFKGCYNTVIIHEPYWFNSLVTTFYGSNNELVINENVRVTKGLRLAFGEDGQIIIGKNSALYNVIMSLRNTKNSNIKIGNQAMFSYNVEIRTSDAHTIYDINTKEVLNPPKDVIIGNHVWIAAGAKIFKGTNIPDNCIVGANSIVTKAFNEENCIIAGTPAKIIKRGVNWHRCATYEWDSYKDFV